MQMKLFYFFAFSTFFVFINHVIAETEPAIEEGICNVDGVKYHVGDDFYEGCVGKCKCVRTASYSCVSRCPPSIPAPGINCREIVNPYDSCCKLTICDPVEVPIGTLKESIDSEY